MRKRFAALILMLFLTVSIGCAADKDRAIGQNVYIDGIDVSGLSRAEAIEKVQAGVQKQLIECTGTVTNDVGDSVEFTADKLSVKTDTEEVVDEALQGGIDLFCDENKTLETTAVFDTSGDAERIGELVKELNREPEDAKVCFNAEADGYFDFSGGTEGFEVDAEKLAKAMDGMIVEDGIELFAEGVKLPPEYSVQEARQEHTLLAKFSTSFKEEPFNAENRVFNIVKAAELINGSCILAGESFDTNKVLGDRTEENGWRTAPGIRNGKYEQEYGGGVCQVSTTLYNAALLANFEINERHHHSWPMGYIEKGRDATISTGGPDLIFTNTSGASAYIFAIADETDCSMTVCIVGKPSSDYAYIEIKTDCIETIAQPTDEYELDSELPDNTKKRERKGKEGYIVRTYREFYDASGQLLERQLVSEDRYEPFSTLYRVSSDLYYASK